MALFAFLSAEFVWLGEFYGYIKSYAKPDERDREFQWKGRTGKEEVGAEESSEGTDYAWETPVSSETVCEIS